MWTFLVLLNESRWFCLAASDVALSEEYIMHIVVWAERCSARYPKYNHIPLCCLRAPSSIMWHTMHLESCYALQLLSLCSCVVFQFFLPILFVFLLFIISLLRADHTKYNDAIIAWKPMWFYGYWHRLLYPQPVALLLLLFTGTRQANNLTAWYICYAYAHFLPSIFSSSFLTYFFPLHFLS